MAMFIRNSVTHLPATVTKKYHYRNDDKDIAAYLRREKEASAVYAQSAAPSSDTLAV